MRVLLFLFVLVTGLPLWAQDPMNLRTYGDEKAPIHLFLFSSLTCPHCADFHREILPKIQKQYVQTKKVHLTIVDMVGDKAAVYATALVRCADENKREHLENRLYANQSQWTNISQTWDQLFSFAREINMTRSEFNQCLSNQSLLEKIIEQRNNLSQLYGITKMPTLLVRHGSVVSLFEGADEQIVMQGLNEIVQEVH